LSFPHPATVANAPTNKISTTPRMFDEAYAIRENGEIDASSIHGRAHHHPVCHTRRLTVCSPVLSFANSSLAPGGWARKQIEARVAAVDVEAFAARDPARQRARAMAAFVAAFVSEGSARPIIVDASAGVSETGSVNGSPRRRIEFSRASRSWMT
jgi:hypothetical protein